MLFSRRENCFLECTPAIIRVQRKYILSAGEIKKSVCIHQIVLAYFRAFVHARIYMCACTNAQTNTFRGWGVRKKQDNRGGWVSEDVWCQMADVRCRSIHYDFVLWEGTDGTEGTDDFKKHFAYICAYTYAWKVIKPLSHLSPLFLINFVTYLL